MSHRFSFAARCALGLFGLSVMLQAQEKKPCWLRDAASPAPSTAYLLCEQGGLWATTDSGNTWKSFSTGATEKQRAFTWLDSKRGFSVGNNGTILSTDDSGRTWTPRSSPVKDHLMDVSFVNDEGWISGYHGVILHSTDAGKTWTQQTTPTSLALEGIYFADKDHGWSVGWSGTILRTTDGGKKWEAVHAPSATWTLSTIYFRDMQDGWVTGFAGQLLHTKDGGASWTTIETPVKSTLNYIAFDSAGRGWITHDDGFLLSEDKGATWQQVNPGGRYFLGKLLPMDKALWAIGQSVVLQQSGTGKEWVKNPNFVADRVVSDSAAPKSGR